METHSPAGLSLSPRFLAGEAVLYSKSFVWAVSGKSFPSYRVSIVLPPIQEMALYVTNRRVLLPCWMFRLVRFEWMAWFARADAAADQDCIQTASVGRTRFLGPYLELITSKSAQHRWRSATARIRIYVSDPETPCRLISEALEPTVPKGVPEGATCG